MDDEETPTPGPSTAAEEADDEPVVVDQQIQQEEEIVWEVKAILDKRIDSQTGLLEYLVEWKKWDGPPTWEPEENCADCKSLIKKFENQLKRRQSSSGSQVRRISQTPRRSQTPSERKSSRIASQNTIQEITIDSTGSSSSSPSPQPPPPPTRTPQTKSAKTTKAKKKNSGPLTERPLSQSSNLQPPRTHDKDEDEEEDTDDSPIARRRAKTPPTETIESSCSEAELVEDKFDKTIKERKLKLKQIVGAVNSSDMTLIVKWHGLEKLEKVPLKDLRRYYCQEVLDFLLNKIIWTTR